MNLDNDRNPIAPHRPSDPPPRRAQTAAGEGATSPATMAPDAPSQDSTDDRDDNTTDDAHEQSRFIVRAILGALDAAERAAVIFALLAWTRTLALAARMLQERLPPANVNAVTDTATELLMEGADAPPCAPVCAVIGTWWAMGPYDIARSVAKGHTSAGDFAAAVEFLASLGDGSTLDAAERAAPASVQPRPAVTPIPNMPDDVDAIESRGRLFVRAAPETAEQVNPLRPAPVLLRFTFPAVTRGTLADLQRDAARVLTSVDVCRSTGPDAAVLRDATGALVELVCADDDHYTPRKVLAELAESVTRLSALRAAATVHGAGDPVRTEDRAAELRDLLMIAARAADACANAPDEWPAE